MRALSRRAAGVDPRQVDVLLAAALIIELELQCWLGPGTAGQHRLITAVASVLFAAPVAARRAVPGLALVSAASVAAIQTLLGGRLLSGPLYGNAAAMLGDVGPVLVLLVLGYSVGSRLGTRRSLASVLPGLALIVSCAFLPGGGGPPTGAGSIAQSVFYPALMIVPGFVVGGLARARRHRSTAFRELAAQAAAEQDARQSAVIAAERARIGSELQDIIAHSISAMIVQAGGARLLLRTDPDRARDSVLTIEHTGREALADLRRLLGMLRKDDDPRALSPQPGLNQLPALIDTTGQAGLTCELRTVGNPVDLTPGVDLVAYRVIEAALLTAARHHRHRVLVTIRYTPHELDLGISGDGTIPGLEQSLQATAQRVALYDGSLSAATPADGGFELQVRLPIGAAALA